MLNEKCYSTRIKARGGFNHKKERDVMTMNVWHDHGDDGVTGWQPIGEPLVRTSNEETKANSKEV